MSAHITNKIRYSISRVLLFSLLLVWTNQVTLCVTQDSLAVGQKSDSNRIKRAPISLDSSIQRPHSDSSGLAKTHADGKIDRWEFDKWIWAVSIAVVAGILLKVIKAAAKKLWQHLQVSYPRYMRSVMSKYEFVVPFVELNVQKVHLGGSEDENAARQSKILFSDLLKLNKSAHIFGKPGSGKTSALKKLGHEASKQALRKEQSRIPVYLKHDEGQAILDQIIEFFKLNDLARDPKYLSRERFEKELLKGRFLFLIDDVHKSLLTNQYRSQLQILFDYNKNVFILMSRDYFRESDFQFDTYDISPLTVDQVKGILKLNLNEDDVSDVFRSIWFRKGLRSLYGTPQMLSLLAQVYGEDGRIPLNKSTMFDRFWKKRNEPESPFMNPKSRRSILGHLAHTMLKKVDNVYWIPEHDCLQIIKSRTILLSSQGFNVGSPEDELNHILASGFLVRTEKGIEFEHDQWQEYFAADEMFQNKIAPGSCVLTYPMREVLYLLAGMYNPNGSPEERQPANAFLQDLAKLDFFLFGSCLENYRSEEQGTLKEWIEPHKDDSFGDSEIRTAYSQLIQSYRNLVNLHFPNLADRFKPDPRREVGAVVGILKLDSLHSYGLRQLRDDSEDKVVIIRGSDIERAMSNSERFIGLRFFEQFGVEGVSHGRASVLYTSPLITAYHRIVRQLEGMIRQYKLCDSTDLRAERLFYEAHALRGTLSISKTKQPLTFRDIMDGFRRKRIADSIRHKHLRGNVLDNRSLNQEVEAMFRSGLDPGRGEGSTTYAGIYERFINDREFEIALEDYLHANQIDVDKSITPPLPELPRKMRFKKQHLWTEEEWEMVVKWSIEFYQRFYSSYMEMLEMNFPTSKYSFPTYSILPINVVLVNDARGRRGEKHVLGGNKDQKEAVTITLTTPEELPRLRKTFPVYKSHHHYPFGLRPRHIFETEPLRKATYELIYREYRELVR
jgi:hypothetical protein